MKTKFKYIYLILTGFIISACGGGGSSDSQTTPPPPEPDPVVSITTLEIQAYEASNEFAKFEINRTGKMSAVNLNYSISGNSDVTRGSVSEDDYSLVYADGGDVGATISLATNQNSRVIEVRPVNDGLHEVTETLILTLTAGSDYQMGSEDTASVQISDASNDAANAKVFIGFFAPQGNAVTTASGVGPKVV